MAGIRMPAETLVMEFDLRYQNQWSYLGGNDLCERKTGHAHNKMFTDALNLLLWGSLKHVPKVTELRTSLLNVSQRATSGWPLRPLGTEVLPRE